MESANLSHWDTVKFLTAEQCALLAVGHDPYSNEPPRAPIVAKLKLLREHMEAGHLRAANWSFDFMKRVQQFKFQDCLTADAPIIRLDGSIEKSDLFHFSLALKNQHAKAFPLLPTPELQHAFDLAWSHKFRSEYYNEQLAGFGALPGHHGLHRTIFSDWLTAIGWETEYRFVSLNEDAVANEAFERPRRTRASILREHASAQLSRKMTDDEIRAMHARLKAQKVRDYTKQTALEANISEVRVRQIVKATKTGARKRAGFLSGM
jgi:hypothetical protein